MSWFRDTPRRDSEPALPDAWFADEFGPQRRRMVEEQLWARDVRDRAVIEAMARVPRHGFVGGDLAARAYDDCPLTIGFGQTISQPFIVARMTELARLAPGARVLEVGVGCGYQTAVLLAAGARVTGIEIIPELAESARATLARLGWMKAEIHIGDGLKAGRPGRRTPRSCWGRADPCTRAASGAACRRRPDGRAVGLPRGPAPVGHHARRREAQARGNLPRPLRADGRQGPSVGRFGSKRHASALFRLQPVPKVFRPSIAEHRRRHSASGYAIAHGFSRCGAGALAGHG